MAVIVLAAAGHSPGVTTSALGLTLAWPGEALLVDCDPCPSQSVLAGYLRGVDAAHRGLGRLLQAHRERRPLEDVIDAECLTVECTDGTSRGFLPGFEHPGSVALFHSAWPDFAAALAARPGQVIVDAGRLGPEGLPAPLAKAAEVILLVTRTSLPALAALRLYLPGVMEAAGRERTGLLLVGESQPYSRAEVESQFGCPAVGQIAFDPVAAAVYSEGTEPPRRFTDSGFRRSLVATAADLAGRSAESRRVIGVPR